MDVSEFEPKKDVLYSYLDKNGNEVMKINTAVAYIASIYNQGQENPDEKYYVKFFRGSIFDPHGMDAARADSSPSNASPLTGEFKKVNRAVFAHYSDYLKTRHNNSLVRAGREYINV